jgi:hypothetical protein
MRRKIDYLFQRPGSRNWHIKLQSPTGRVEKSLRTPDRVQAEILALPVIAEHKAAVLAARPRLVPSWHHEYEPGREHVGPDGERITFECLSTLIRPFLARGAQLHITRNYGTDEKTSAHAFHARTTS